MFADKVTVNAVAGRGGDGIVTFRREKFIPRGGPDGGDGGNGGSVIVIAREKVPHLAGIRNLSTFRGTDGERGGKSRKFGHGGEDAIIEVPVGSTVTDTETGELLADLVEHNQKIVVAKGGHGGRGNVHFATPTNRVPHQAENGAEGEERTITFELTIPADAALIGLPASGKTELHRRMTGSRQKHTGYQFATRNPYIGVCTINPYTRVKLLDLPSLCEGSSEGQGLGNRFLRHLRRVSLIIFILDPTIPTAPAEQLRVLRAEIEKFNPEFLEKNLIAVYSKTDMIGSSRLPGSRALHMPVHKLSSTTDEGVPELSDAIIRILKIEEE